MFNILTKQVNFCQHFPLSKKNPKKHILFSLAVYCEYYNGPEECRWHYEPCHKACYKTCLNPEGTCINPLPNLEGNILLWIFLT